MADDAAIVADDAASIADVAAEEAAIMDVVAASEAEDIADEADIDDGVGVVVVVVVVDVSSFFEHAANETQAASVTISNAVFMLLLELKILPLSALTGKPRFEEPVGSGHGNLWHFQCLIHDYRHLRVFP